MSDGTIETTCPVCRKFYRVSGDRAGWRVRCKRCETYFQVPEVEDISNNPSPKRCEFCLCAKGLRRAKSLRQCNGCSRWGCASCVYQEETTSDGFPSYTDYLCRGCHGKQGLAYIIMIAILLVLAILSAGI